MRLSSNSCNSRQLSCCRRSPSSPLGHTAPKEHRRRTSSSSSSGRRTADATCRPLPRRRRAQASNNRRHRPSSTTCSSSSQALDQGPGRGFMHSRACSHRRLRSSSLPTPSSSAGGRKATPCFATFGGQAGLAVVGGRAGGAASTRTAAALPTDQPMVLTCFACWGVSRRSLRSSPSGPHPSCPPPRGCPPLPPRRNVRWQWGDIVPDYLVGRDAACLFLSLRWDCRAAAAGAELRWGCAGAAAGAEVHPLGQRQASLALAQSPNLPCPASSTSPAHGLTPLRLTHPPLHPPPLTTSDHQYPPPPPPLPPPGITCSSLSTSTPASRSCSAPSACASSCATWTQRMPWSRWRRCWGPGAGGMAAGKALHREGLMPLQRVAELLSGHVTGSCVPCACSCPLARSHVRLRPPPCPPASPSRLPCTLPRRLRVPPSATSARSSAGGATRNAPAT